LETGRVHGEWSWTHADYVVNAGFHWVSQGLPEHVSEMCMGFVHFSPSPITDVHVKQSFWGTELLKEYRKPNSACLNQGCWYQRQRLLLVSAALILPFSEYEFELFCLHV